LPSLFFSSLFRDIRYVGPFFLLLLPFSLEEVKSDTPSTPFLSSFFFFSQRKSVEGLSFLSSLFSPFPLPFSGLETRNLSLPTLFSPFSFFFFRREKRSGWRAIPPPSPLPPPFFFPPLPPAWWLLRRFCFFPLLFFLSPFFPPPFLKKEMGDKVQVGGRRVSFLHPSPPLFPFFPPPYLFFLRED